MHNDELEGGEQIGPYSSSIHLGSRWGEIKAMKDRCHMLPLSLPPFHRTHCHINREAVFDM